MANLTACDSPNVSAIAFMFIASVVTTPLNPISPFNRSVMIAFDIVAGFFSSLPVFSETTVVLSNCGYKICAVMIISIP